MKIVVLGGYGNFGARISRALAHTPGIDLVIAGRDADKARLLARECDAQPAQLDINDPHLAYQLAKLGAGLVIHTAGPFQSQGYSVAHAAATAAAHYIDLADGRRFVCDFPLAMDAMFRQQNRAAFTGASTVPALSSAVVNHLTRGWRQVTEIDCCIGPAQTAPRGIATMAAVLDYCGAPIQVWRGGSWETQYGWSSPRRVAFAHMRSRLGALCDIPDLELFPAQYPGVQTVMFRAALELGVSQRGMAALALLRRWGLLRQPARLAGLLNRAADHLDRFGTALGGMMVRVQGLDAAGAPAQAAWHIAADDDHGPEIPCMAAIILARRLAAGTINTTGAMTASGQVGLLEFGPEFRKWRMQTNIER